MDKANEPPTPPQEDAAGGVAAAGMLPDDLEPISPDMSDSDVYLNNEDSQDNQIDKSVNNEKSAENTNEPTAETNENVEKDANEEAPPVNQSDTMNDEENNVSAMEVDETAAKEGGENEDNVEKDAETTENVSENADKTVDESMEQDEVDRPEEVDMENLDETVNKDKSIHEDPFDALRADKSINDSMNESGADVSMDQNHTDDKEDDVGEDNAGGDDDANVSAAADDAADDAAADEDDDGGRDDYDAGDNDKEQENSETAVVDAPATDEALDDIEQGKGVDEELSLLPDAEREITDADKERAILAEEEAAAKDTENAMENDDNDVPLIDENDKDKDTSEQQNDDVDASELNDTVAVEDISPELLAAAPTEGEIKEIQTDLPEKTCVECKTLRLCKYTLLLNDELTYLCEIDCVTAYRESNSDKVFTLSVKKVPITLVIDVQKTCIGCNENSMCKYRLNNAESEECEYLCNDNCLQKFIGKNVEKYLVKKKRYLIEEITETSEPFKCLQCSDEKKSRFRLKQDDEELYVCEDVCLNLLMKEQADRFRVKRRSVRVRDLPKRAGTGSATISPLEPATETPKFLARTEDEAKEASRDREASFIRRCAQCFSMILQNDRQLNWETMDFCNEGCLGLYQNVIGAACTTCQNAVSLTSLGKYSVRFGYDIRQFCRSACLDEFKKGLKVCSYCQKDISKNQDGFLASIGGQFKDFCTAICMKKYDEMCNPKKRTTAGICSVCNNVDQVRVEILVDAKEHGFCSNPCFSAFKFVNNICPDKCSMCTKFFERKSDDAHTIYQDNNAILFCSKICMNIFIMTNRKIVPCQWCKVKKYNLDMIQKTVGQTVTTLCSLNCLTLCEVSMNAISMKKQKCDQCSSMITPQYHLTMSDSSIRNFCTYQCVMSFQSQFSRAPLTLDGEQPAGNSPVPTGLPKRIKGGQQPQQQPPQQTVKAAQNKKQTKASKNLQMNQSTKVPVISNVTSLASGGLSTRNRNQFSSMSMNLQPVVELEPLPPLLLKKSMNTYSGRRVTIQKAAPSPPRAPTPPPRVEVKTQIVTVPPIPTRVANMSTMCKPAMESKEVTCKPTTCTIGCQTDSSLERKLTIPIPVPIYVPTPIHMYSTPVPFPVPIPLPIPVPIFIPTTRNSAQGIMKEIKKIQDKMPTDPFEAELLMMAEMVAGDKKKSESDSGTDDDDDDYGHHETIPENNTLGEDMLQMALKMAQEYEEPAVDLESAMTANTITPSTNPYEDGTDEHNAMQHHHLLLMEQQRQMQSQRGRKRAQPAQPRNNRQPGTPPNKRQRRQEMPILTPPQPEPPREPVEKADANMCLKFTFGVNAWKQWVMTKNADLEKSSIRRKPFKSELLQLTADELNYSLCLFVKEVRKPNGSEYAPDTIYYLVLGIQQYLYENGRIDNIFTDPYYEKFTDCLDDVAKKFSVLYNDSQYIVTRVEEEHLWECKQLGAHSPHVLLSTLMFFNTKHFNLTTVEEHMQLSFSHIMKHWKRNPNQVGASKLPGSRNVLLRFYPPQSALDSNSRKKKVYEQQENEENPLRCPVKLYEFYLSKCPESVKTRNDVFYLQPERSCVPDSPVWYSTQALGKESLCKMLHRVKMVKEINIALLTS